MVKKKTKKKIKSRKKITPKKKKTKKIPAKGQGSKKQGERFLGNIEHYFGKISVAALKLKAPLSIGDIIHIKGPHTDFFQKIESMQIEHQNVQKAKKGDDIGIKVKEKCRVTDTAYLADKKLEITIKTEKPLAVQEPIFPSGMFKKPKPLSPRVAKPTSKPAPPPPARPAPKPEKPNPYANTKFLKF